MIDSGAEISLIQEYKVPEDAEIQPRSIVILGIEGAKTCTLGKFMIKFCEKIVFTNIEPENCGSIGDGVLGADILFSSNVTIFGEDKILRVASSEIPFIQNLMSDETYADFIRNSYEENSNSGVTFIEYGGKLQTVKEVRKSYVI